MADPKLTAEEKKLEKARENVARLKDVVAAAWVLCSGWESTGFYDRQDPAGALALHEALAAYESSG